MAMLSILVPLLVAVVGFLILAFAANTSVKAAGRAMMWCGVWCTLAYVSKNWSHLTLSLGGASSLAVRAFPSSADSARCSAGASTEKILGRCFEISCAKIGSRTALA